MSSSDQVVLQAVSTGMTLWRHEGLARITAGRLDIIQSLAYAASGCQSPHYLSNEKTDCAMLKLMPALQWIDVGAQPLCVPFHGTVRGKLTLATVHTFQMLCIALGFVALLVQMRLSRPVN